MDASVEAYPFVGSEGKAGDLGDTRTAPAVPLTRFSDSTVSRNANYK